MERGVVSQGRDEYATSRARGIAKGKGITTPRWLMFPAGLASVVLGIVAILHSSGPDGLLTLTSTKAAIYIVLGLIWMWMAITWSYMVRKSLTRFFGWCLLALGIAGLAVDEEKWFVNVPWEVALYFVLAAAFLAAGYWKRPFDYRD